MEITPGDNEKFVPSASYYEDADLVEYVTADEPCVFRRVDSMLTIAFSLDTKEPIGFRLKGFKSIYLTRIKPKYDVIGGIDFLTISDILTSWIQEVGNQVFSDEAKEEYRKAIRLSKGVVLEELPRAA